MTPIHVPMWLDVTEQERILAKANVTSAQRALALKHGTPAQFAEACYAAVPGWISMDEAAEAIAKYAAEWNAAK